MYFVPTRLRQSVGRITEDTRDGNKERVITYYRNSISALSAFLPALYLTKTDNVCFEDEYKGTPTLILVLDYKSSDNWHYCYFRFLFSKSSAECFLNIVFFLLFFLLLFVSAFFFFLISSLELFHSLSYNNLSFHSLLMSIVFLSCLFVFYNLFWLFSWLLHVLRSTFIMIFLSLYILIFLCSPFVFSLSFIHILSHSYLIIYAYFTYYFIFFLDIHECFWYQILGLFSSFFIILTILALVSFFYRLTVFRSCLFSSFLEFYPHTKFVFFFFALTFTIFFSLELFLSS